MTGPTTPTSLPVPDPPRDADGRVDLDRVLFACGPADLLESCDDTGWSYVIPHGRARLVDDGRRSTWHDADGRAHDMGPDPFAAIDQVTRRFGITPATPAPSQGTPVFTGGLVGAMAYELGARVEGLQRRLAADRNQPHLWLHLAESAVAVTPDREHAVIVGRDLLDRGGLPTRHEALRARVTDAASAPPSAPGPLAYDAPLTTSFDRDAYLDTVRTVLEHIAAGEVFQVNLTQRLTSEWDGDAHGLYRALRHHSPAPFGAVLPDLGVASVSPETFLAVDGNHVRTRPIKGTRPRADDPILDAALADDLATADKDRAENVMVVDLERNDLGRVCRPGSVQVPELTVLEAHPTVWHLVSTVAGELRDDVGYGDLLRATFPCGSITGAPKIAAMGLIDRYETAPRGWYCGAVGFLAPGASRWSVAIRTATLHADGTVDYGAGGGIVADSDPAAEYHESFDKAAAFLRAVGAPRPGALSAVLDRS